MINSCLLKSNWNNSKIYMRHTERQYLSVISFRWIRRENAFPRVVWEENIFIYSVQTKNLSQEPYINTCTTLRMSRKCHISKSNSAMYIRWYNHTAQVLANGLLHWGWNSENSKQIFVENQNQNQEIQYETTFEERRYKTNTIFFI